MKKTKTEIEQEILDFLNENSTHKGDGSQPGCGLDHGIACALGTCRNNVPRVTAVDFHNEGLDLWILADPGGKLGNIRENPKVSVAIYTKMDHSIENRSIQLWGNASIVTFRHKKELFMKMAEKLGVLDAIRKGIQGNLYSASPKADFDSTYEKALINVALLKVEPGKIALLIVSPGKEMRKLIWEKAKPDYFPTLS